MTTEEKLRRVLKDVLPYAENEMEYLYEIARKGVDLEVLEEAKRCAAAIARAHNVLGVQDDERRDA